MPYTMPATSPCQLHLKSSKKPLVFCEIDTRQKKRGNEVSKNELLRAIFTTCCQNKLKFHYVLMDSWFAARKNFDFI